MVECPITGEEFDSKEEMHLSWRDHWDELNSHQKDKVKKAEKKQEEKKKQKLNERKKKAGYGLGAALGLALLAVVGIQLMQMVPSGELDVDLEDRPVLGEEDAPVTVIEFGDYKCSFCQEFEFEVKDRLAEDGYFEDGDVNFYYLHFPLPVDPVGSPNAALAAECVADQDHEEFWDYHSALFENQQLMDFDEENLVNLAEDNTDIDHEEFEQCLSNQETQSIVDQDRDAGTEAGVSSTPTVFVNGERVGDWDYDSMVNVIEEELDNQE